MPKIIELRPGLSAADIARRVVLQELQREGLSEMEAEAELEHWLARRADNNDRP